MTTALATATRFEATPFTAAHLEPVLDVLLTVAGDDRAYPPAGAGTDRETLAAWLLESPVTGRWVILADGRPAGHIMAAPPRSHLTRALTDAGHTSRSPEGICEISRFFTDPRLRGLGLGSALFRTACSALEETGHQPAVAAPDSSRDAVRFFAGHGMDDLGLSVSDHGLSRILVRNPAAIRTARLAAMRTALYNLLS